jgi:hypothetical protein
LDLGDHKICDDAKAWASEARRRVQLFKDAGWASDGDRVTFALEAVGLFLDRLAPRCGCADEAGSAPGAALETPI